MVDNFDYYARNGEAVRYLTTDGASHPGVIRWTDEYGAQLDVEDSDVGQFFGWEFLLTGNQIKAAEFEAKAAALRAGTCTCKNCA